MCKSFLNETIFINQLIPESIYLLGFLWGDGYFHKGRQMIRLEIIKKDLDNLQNIINKTGHWTYFYRNRKNRQPQGGITVQNPLLFQYLSTLDYDKKSFFSHKKAIEHIPIELQYLWLRGYFDADGCIYYNKKNRCCQSTFCSKYEQDWDYLSNLFKQNNIHNTIIRRIQKANKHSIIRIVGKSSCENLFTLLYPNKIYDMGLLRKFEKFNSINFHDQRFKSSKP